MRNMLRRMLIPFLCLLGLFCSLQAQDCPNIENRGSAPRSRRHGPLHWRQPRAGAAESCCAPTATCTVFEPAPQDIAAAGQARLVLASGKNLEPYLPKLKARPGRQCANSGSWSLRSADVPVEEDTADHDHEHDGDCCAHGPNDPH